MSEKYSLRIKIGDAEFDAEGPEAIVQVAFEKFLDALESAPTPATHGPALTLEGKGTVGRTQTERPALPQAALDRAFRVDRERGVVSLNFLPKSDGDQQKADAAILLMYGFQKVLGEDHAKITKLNEGLRTSGLTLERLDRVIGVHNGYFMKGGTRSGSRYTLTNAGERWAEDTLRESFATE